jgi:hypothetical protein
MWIIAVVFCGIFFEFTENFLLLCGVANDVCTHVVDE